MPRKPPPAGVPVALLALVLLGGCSAGADDVPVAAHRATSAPSSDGSGDADAVTPSVRRLTGSGVALAPGRYELGFLGGGAGTPGAVVEVPRGYEDGTPGTQRLPDGSGWYVVSHDRDRFLGLYVVGTVERDACLRPRDDGVDPGSSVADLAGSLAAQRSTRSSRPERVSVAGHRGMYLRLTGPADLGACDPDPGLWDGRGLYGDRQVDQVWILDVDGQRLVVDASHVGGGSTSQAELAELSAMVRSLRLLPAGS